MRALLVLIMMAVLGMAQAAPAAPTRILFIGNSLTSAGDIPGRLQKLATAMGKDVRVESVTHNGYSLEDHWRDGRAMEAIRKGWDIVVLQQGTSAHEDARQQLIDYSRRFARAARAAGATPAIFMVWPEKDRPRDFEACIRAHRDAAHEVKGTLVPAGEAWLRALTLDRKLHLYGDVIHPAGLGADLVVLTAWFTFFPAGEREFDEAYVAKAARALQIPADRRDQLFDAATRAVDEPLRIH